MKRLPLLLLVLVLAGFLAGLAHLFRLRFEAGDIYPPYSSLRADPLGTKALYLALGQLGASRRHFRPLDKIGHGHGTTLFFLGAKPDELEFTPAEFRHLEGFVHTGGRLVLGLFPTYRPASTHWPAGPTPAPGAGAGTAPGARRARARPNPPAELADLIPEPLTTRWKLAFGHAELPKEPSGLFRPQKAKRVAELPLPEALSCHTSLFFDQLDPAWRVLYARPGARAVLIERNLGDGTIVLCADSYPFSNQALREDRQSALLAWLVGPNRRALFDEAHLGVREEPGLGALARQYRLHGLGAALLVLAGLFIWKNAVPFLPPTPKRQDNQPQTVPGRDMASGFINLLRRNLRPAELLDTCLLEWKKSCARQIPQAKLEAMQAIIEAENAKPPAQRDPVATYRRLTEALAGGQRPRASVEGHR